MCRSWQRVSIGLEFRQHGSTAACGVRACAMRLMATRVCIRHASGLHLDRQARALQRAPRDREAHRAHGAHGLGALGVCGWSSLRCWCP